MYRNIHEVRVRVSDELSIKMSNHPEINWSEFCRLAIDHYLENNQKPLNNQFDNMDIVKKDIMFEESIYVPEAD